MYITVALSVLLLSATVVDGMGQTPSDNLLNFLSTLGGEFSNQRQIMEESGTREHHAPQFMTFIPVEVPALSPSITYVFEENVNGEAYRLLLIVVSEEDNNVIRFKKYNLTNGSEVPRVGGYDLNKLKELKASDLHTDPACDMLQKPIGLEPTVFMGTWPVCHIREPGQEALNYAVVRTCTTIAFQSPRGAAEATIRFPNDVDRIKKYPLLPYMLGDRQDYVDPCGN